MDKFSVRNSPLGLPDFFIIGAPKCGTTALSEYLRRHPNVGFSEPKEPHYFNDDFSSRHIYSLKEYMECFSRNSGREMAVGEGSVFYLRSESAVPNILEYSPNAKFIVMLRNPVDAAYSWHWQAVYSFGEDIVDFEEAWFAQADRLAGKRLPKHNQVREALQYGALFRYGDQLARLYDKVPRERVHIILFEDFKGDPPGSYAATLDFLGVPKMDLPEYGVVNRSKKFRFQIVESVLREALEVKKALGVKKSFGVVSRFKRWNTKVIDRPPLRGQFIEELREYYRDDLLKAEALIQRDLSGWING